MPQMRVDLHCDTLTARSNFDGEVNLKYLLEERAFQCFAAFVRDDAAAYAAAKNLFYTALPASGFKVVKNRADFESAEGRACCALTCENIGFTGGKYGNVCSLRADGVIMASLVWNEENSLAYPNARSDNRRESRPLKEAGREALRALDDSGIIVDISHLSDGGAAEILKNRKIPVVASHSNAYEICKNARNLTDSQLKAIADCGGVVGVNFYKKFLGGNGDFSAVAAHIKHIIAVAGEDTPAFGSDWDGTPNGGICISPHNMPRLFDFLRAEGVPFRIVEKVACGNFLRVLKEVCG